MTDRLRGTDWYQNLLAVCTCLSPTFSRIGEDLFGDVELVLCCSGPVLHPSSALHGEVDIAGNC